MDGVLEHFRIYSEMRVRMVIAKEFFLVRFDVKRVSEMKKENNLQNLLKYSQHRLRNDAEMISLIIIFCLKHFFKSREVTSEYGKNGLRQTRLA